MHKLSFHYHSQEHSESRNAAKATAVLPCGERAYIV